VAEEIYKLDIANQPVLLWIPPAESIIQTPLDELTKRFTTRSAEDTLVLEKLNKSCKGTTAAHARFNSETSQEATGHWGQPHKLQGPGDDSRPSSNPGQDFLLGIHDTLRIGDHHRPDEGIREIHVGVALLLIKCCGDNPDLKERVDDSLGVIYRIFHEEVDKQARTGVHQLISNPEADYLHGVLERPENIDTLKDVLGLHEDDYLATEIRVINFFQAALPKSPVNILKAGGKAWLRVLEKAWGGLIFVRERYMDQAAIDLLYDCTCVDAVVDRLKKVYMSQDNNLDYILRTLNIERWSTLFSQPVANTLEGWKGLAAIITRYVRTQISLGVRTSEQLMLYSKKGGHSNVYNWRSKAFDRIKAANPGNKELISVVSGLWKEGVSVTGVIFSLNVGPEDFSEMVTDEPVDQQ
jgi:hypothetical protein